jgi:hypothetical protein
MNLSIIFYDIIIILLFFNNPGSTVINIVKMIDTNIKLIGR